MSTIEERVREKLDDYYPQQAARCADVVHHATRQSVLLLALSLDELRERVAVLEQQNAKIQELKWSPDP